MMIDKTRIKLQELNEQYYDEWLVLFNDYNVFGIPDTNVVWRKLMNPKSTLAGFIAVYENKLVGFVHYLHHESAHSTAFDCHLSDLYVSPDFRNLGLGKQLIDQVRLVAKFWTWRRVYWTTGHNSDARKLYDKYVKSDCVGYQIKA